MPNEDFEVRDLRHQDWLWTSKELLFDPNIDEKMYKVYSGLAAYANNQTQKAFPSIATLVKKLHMGRNTVIRALQKLEADSFIGVSRVQGQSNVYSLLEINTTQNDKPKQPRKEEPGHIAHDFFQGVRDLRDKKTSEESEKVRLFLVSLITKYPRASKDLIWKEVQKFESYWTEMNATGTKERWQKQDAFQVDRRLVTWFAKKDEFKKVDIINNKKRIV